MRKLMMKMSISIEGFVCGTNGENDWIFKDEYHLFIHPVALGSGLPIFTDLTIPLYLKLVDVKAFPG